MATIVNNLTVLAVEDLDVCRSFYLDKLGFEEYFRTDGWSFLRRGNLLLRVGHGPGIEPISQFADHLLVIQAVVDDAQALYEEFSERGADASVPEDKPWGQREFVVVTPDGHRLLFTQTL